MHPNLRRRIGGRSARLLAFGAEVQRGERNAAEGFHCCARRHGYSVPTHGSGAVARAPSDWFKYCREEAVENS